MSNDLQGLCEVLLAKQFGPASAYFRLIGQSSSFTCINIYYVLYL